MKKRTYQGPNFGFIYKDYEAFMEASGKEVCYIPEFLDNTSLEGVEYIDEKHGYTRFDIERLCKDHGFDTAMVFEMLDWQSPETLIGELAEQEEEYQEVWKTKRMKDLKKIQKSRRLRKLFIRSFKMCLHSCGEILVGNVSDKTIFHRFEEQGYWSGVRYNIHFDMDLGFEYEQRRFGQ